MSAKGAKRRVTMWVKNFYKIFKKYFVAHTLMVDRQKFVQFIRMLCTRCFILNGIVKHLYWLIELSSHTSTFHYFPGCEFPQEWHGEWNLEGERESLNISLEDFGTKGFCLKNEDDIYVIYKRYVPDIEPTKKRYPLKWFNRDCGNRVMLF